MSKLEAINQALIEIGFIIEDVMYTLERKSQKHFVINGQHQVQEFTHIFKMSYIGDAIFLDDENNEIEGSELCGFDVLDEQEHSLTTLYVESVNDLRYYLNI